MDSTTLSQESLPAPDHFIFHDPSIVVVPVDTTPLPIIIDTPPCDSSPLDSTSLSSSSSIESNPLETSIDTQHEITITTPNVDTTNEALRIDFENKIDEKITQLNNLTKVVDSLRSEVDTLNKTKEIEQKTQFFNRDNSNKELADQIVDRVVSAIKLENSKNKLAEMVKPDPPQNNTIIHVPLKHDDEINQGNLERFFMPGDNSLDDINFARKLNKNAVQKKFSKQYNAQQAQKRYQQVASYKNPNKNRI